MRYGKRWFRSDSIDGVFSNNNGFGTSRAVEIAKNKYLAQVAMFEGKPFACHSPRHSAQINLYGVSCQVNVFAEGTIEKTIEELQKFVDKDPKVI